MDGAEARGFTGRDGVELVYREHGEGRPLVLLHGFGSSGSLWFDRGPARRLSALGHRVIAPHLRGHGQSARPHDPGRYPPDVLADDGFALLDALGLDPEGGAYDLGGYSLGARVALRLLVRGARPGRAVLGGQGLDALTKADQRGGPTRAMLDDLLAGAPPDSGAGAWIVRSGGDPLALRHVLDSLVPTSPRVLGEVLTPALVFAGDRDGRWAAARRLAEVLPVGRFVAVRGDHLDALAAPELAEDLAWFLRS